MYMCNITGCSNIYESSSIEVYYNNPTTFNKHSTKIDSNERKALVNLINEANIKYSICTLLSERAT